MDHQQLQPAWWALALSEEVTSDKPVAARCGLDEVVLFRDKAGVVRAFEDRCPHRRVQLSLGRVKDGALQCGYHGWTFEGGTGRCIAIPNLNADEKVPDRYAVGTYAVHERDGFIYAWIGPASAARPDDLPSFKLTGSGREFTGQAALSVAHDEFVAALFDGPMVLLDFATVRPIDFLLSDPELMDEHIALDRAATWKVVHAPDRYATEWPLVFRVSVEAFTGQALVEIRDQGEALLLSAVVAAAPAARGTTSVRWRCRTADEMTGPAASLTRALGGLGRQPFAVKRFINGEALANLRVGPSAAWREALRAGSGGITAAA